MGLFDIFKKKKNDSTSLYLDAVALEKEGKLDEAEEIYKTIAKDSPSDAKMCIEFLIRREKWEEVIKEGEKAYLKHGANRTLSILKTLAECYRYGKGTTIDLNQAYKYMDSYKLYVDKSERIESVKFQLECARKYLSNAAPSPNQMKWELRLDDCKKELAKLGDISALHQLVNGRNINTAYEFGMEAARNGETWALITLFWRFLDNMERRPENFRFDEVVSLLERGAEANDTDCMFALSICYAKDLVSHYTIGYSENSTNLLKSPYPADPDKFFELLKKAYDGGNRSPAVLTLMAQYYAMGKIWVTREFRGDPFYVQKTRDIDQKKAFALLKEAEERRLEVYKSKSIEERAISYWSSHERYMLTIMHFDGYGCDKDTEKAYKYNNNGKEPDGPVSELKVLDDELRILTLLRENMSDAESIDSKIKRLFGVLSKNEKDSENQTNEEE